MENQKIQQLIRLASIADKNGDYKIADKIFEKLAAAPPPGIQRYKIRPIMGEVLQTISELARLKPLVETVESISKYAAGMPESVKKISFLDLNTLYPKFKELKALKELTSPTAADVGKIRNLENQFTGQKERILTLFNIVDNNKFDIEALYQRHLTAPQGDPFRKNTFAEVIEAYYKEVAEELRKINPEQLNSLSPNDKALIDSLSMKLKLYQKGEEAVTKQLLQQGKEQVTTTTTNNPNALQRFFGVKTVTEQRTFETERLPVLTSIINLATLPGRKFSEALGKYNKIKSINAIHGLSPAQQKQLKQEASKAATAAASTAKIGDVIKMIDNIPKIIENYDKRFIASILEAEKVIRADPQTRNFDLSRPKDFDRALEMARQLFENSEERLLLEGLILQIQTIFKREIELSKSILTKLEYSNIDAKSILQNISERNKGMVENLGIQQLGLENLIARINKNEPISIEEFLEIQIKILPKMKQIMHPGLKLFLGSAGTAIGGAYYFKRVLEKKKAEGAAKAAATPEAKRQQKIDKIKQQLQNSNTDEDFKNLTKGL